MLPVTLLSGAVGFVWSMVEVVVEAETEGSKLPPVRPILEVEEAIKFFDADIHTEEDN